MFEVFHLWQDGCFSLHKAEGERLCIVIHSKNLKPKHNTKKSKLKCVWTQTECILTIIENLKRSGPNEKRQSKDRERNIQIHASAVTVAHLISSLSTAVQLSINPHTCQL